jgi:hypothetical protein
MTSGNFTSTADIDFYIDVDTATGAELVMLSDNITTRHQVGMGCVIALPAAACFTLPGCHDAWVASGLGAWLL